jgi:hypothetical protein
MHLSFLRRERFSHGDSFGRTLGSSLSASGGFPTCQSRANYDGLVPASRDWFQSLSHLKEKSPRMNLSFLRRERFSKRDSFGRTLGSSLSASGGFPTCQSRANYDGLVPASRDWFQPTSFKMKKAQE